MKLTTILLLCLCISTLKSKTNTPVDNFKPVKAIEFVIDLRLPPQQRYSKTPQKYCQILKDFKDTYYSFLTKKLPDGYISQFNQAQKIFSELNKETEFVQEMQGIAQHCGLEYSYIFLYNYVYELSELGCTSIIFKDESDKLRLISNLDYNFSEVYSKITFKGIYLGKNGKIIGYSSFIFGFVGFSRGFKIGEEGRLSVALNARGIREERSANLNQLLIDMRIGTISQIIYSFRKEFLESQNLTDLSARYSALVYSSPAYFIICDDEEGSVIEKKARGVNAVYMIGEEYPFLVQTNIDRDMKIISDPRKKRADEYFGKRVGEKIKTESVFQELMSKSPNFMYNLFFSELMRTISTSYTDDDKMEIYVWVKKNK